MVRAFTGHQVADSIPVWGSEIVFWGQSLTDVHPSFMVARSPPWGRELNSELDFHIWNANWPMKCEAKMAVHGGQFWTSVSVLYAGLYVSFSLLRDSLLFWKFSLLKIHKTCLQKIEMSLRISNIFRQNQTELHVIYFHENKLPNWRETW